MFWMVPCILLDNGILSYCVSVVFCHIVSPLYCSSVIRCLFSKGNLPYSFGETGSESVWRDSGILRQSVEDLPIPLALLPLGRLRWEWEGHDQWRIKVVLWHRHNYSRTATQNNLVCLKCYILRLSFPSGFASWAPCSWVFQTPSILCTTWSRWSIASIPLPPLAHWEWHFWTTGEKSNHWHQIYVEYGSYCPKNRQNFINTPYMYGVQANYNFTPTYMES